MMIDQHLARLRAHSNNINRYRRLLRTKLLPLEREFIERRLAEEEQAVRSLRDEQLPDAINDPQPRSRPGLEAQL